MRFIDRIIGILTKPDSTTKDIANDPRIEEGLLLVGIFTILLVVENFVMVTQIKYVGSYQGLEASTYANMSMISAIAMALVVGLIGWPVIAGICHILSLFFGGEGKLYPRMMALTGYTAVPIIIAAILSILLTLALPATTVDISQGVSAISKGITTGNPTWILVSIITLIGSAWVAFVMAYAVRNGEKIGMGKSGIIVGLLFIANLAISFSSLLL